MVPVMTDLAEKFEPHGVLVLVATKDVPEEALQRASLRMRDQLSAKSGGAERTRPTAPAQIRATHQFHDR